MTKNDIIMFFNEIMQLFFWDFECIELANSQAAIRRNKINIKFLPCVPEVMQPVLTLL